MEERGGESEGRQGITEVRGRDSSKSNAALIAPKFGAFKQEPSQTENDPRGSKQEEEEAED